MRNRVLALLLSASYLTAPALAFAGPWDQTFGSAGGEVAPATDRVIVVAAGERTESLTAAAAALVESSRSSAKLVMDDAALGDVSTLDDAAIVAKARHLPVDRIAVVRVFPGADGDTAVVTIYDKEDAVLTSFSGVAGQAIAAESEAGSGVSAGAAAAIGSLAADRQKSRTEAEEAYEKTYLWFEDWVAMQANTGAVVGGWSVPYQGKYKKALEGAEFYEIVGREDLASSYRSRSAWRTGLVLGGYGAVLGGSAVALWGTFTFSGDCSFDDPNYDTCQQEASDASMNKLVAGTAMVGVGLAVALVGGLINPHPVENVEARRLADEYNKGLKQELGLASRGVEVEPSLVMMDGGGGLGLSGSFH